MTTLRIKNDYSWLITDNQSLKNKLSEKLKFKNRNVFMNPLYKQSIWDGCTRFFDSNTGKFLTGLLTEVTLVLYYLNIKYETIDERTHTKLLYEKIDDQFLNQWLPKSMQSLTLEDYQVDLVNEALQYRRGIIKAPTSAGKSYIMLSIMKCIPPGTPILFLANRKSLIRQNYKIMVKWGLPNVGILSGESHKPNIITCSTVQSLHHLGKLLPKFKVLIVDEVHMMMGKTAIRAYKKLTGCDIRIAVSATPFKFEQKKKNKSTTKGDEVHKYNVKGYFGPVFPKGNELTTELLQDRGRLSKSKCYFYPIDEPKNIEFDIFQDAVTNGIAQNWYFHQVIQKLAAALKGRTLILVDRIAHGDALGQLIPNSLWVQGKDNDATRDYVINQLREAKNNVVAIATQQIFGVGVDFFAHNIVNCAGGKAEHDIIQRMGRGLRIADDKEILTYYDFIFRTNKYLESHSNNRIKILSIEGHEIIIKDALDF